MEPHDPDALSDIIAGVFDLNRRLGGIAEDVTAIRRLLEEEEDDDGED
jgi:hypothetical protein